MHRLHSLPLLALRATLASQHSFVCWAVGVQSAQACALDASSLVASHADQYPVILFLPPVMSSDSVLLQIKQLFGFCGTIRSCRMVGGNRFCFVEYSMPGVSTSC